MAEVGEISYVVKVDTSGMVTGIKEANENLEDIGKGGKSFDKVKTALDVVGKTAVVGAAAATGAVAGLSKSALDAYADFEQLTGGIEKIFGEDTFDVVMENAQQAFRTAGLSANEYMETVTGFSSSLIQSLGGDTAKAADYADRAIRDMADNANTFGSSIGSIQNAYQGFAKQNYGMLDNLKLGYGGTKEEMERLIADASKMTDEMEELGVSVDGTDMSFGNIVNAISVVQQHLKVTGTTAKEAAGTISGSIAMMKSNWQNFTTMLGETGDIDGAMTEFAKDFAGTVVTVAKNIIPRLSVILDGITEAFGAFIPILAEQLPPLIEELLPSLLESITTLLTALFEALPTIIQTFLPMITQVVMTAINILISILPQIVQSLLNVIITVVQQLIPLLPQILTTIVNAIIQIATLLTKPENINRLLQAAILLFMALVSAVPEIISALSAALPELIDNVINFLIDPGTIKMLIKASVQLFMALVSAVPQILSALFTAFTSLFSSLWNKLTSIFKSFAGKFGDALGGAFKSAINGVLSFIEGFLNAPINAINGLIGVINVIPGVNIGKLANLQLGRLATGGIVPSTNGGRLILAGEAGEDEWVVPESKMASMIEQLQGNGVGGNVTINVEGIWATSESQKREVAQDIWEKINEVNKSRMGAYL